MAQAIFLFVLSFALIATILMSGCTGHADFPQGEFTFSVMDARTVKCDKLQETLDGTFTCAEQATESQGGDFGENAKDVVNGVINVVGGLLPRGVSGADE